MLQDARATQQPARIYALLTSAFPARAASVSMSVTAYTSKAGLRFGPDHGFRSIRQTVATPFENPGVAVGVVADIRGREKAGDATCGRCRMRTASAVLEAP
jgi:hypothetical protein